MADEIKSTYTLTVTNGDFSYTYSPGTKSITQSAVGMDGGTVSLTTAEANIDLSNLTTEGVTVLVNTDATNNAIIGPQVGTGSQEDLITLKPGEDAHFRMTSGATLRARSSAGTVILMALVFED